MKNTIFFNSRVIVLAIAFAVTPSCGTYTIDLQPPIRASRKVQPLASKTVASVIPIKTKIVQPVAKLSAPVQRYHTVQTGEYLYGLAKIYGITIGKIVALNPQYQSTPPNVGDKVRIR